MTSPPSLGPRPPACVDTQTGPIVVNGLCLSGHLVHATFGISSLKFTILNLKFAIAKGMCPRQAAGFPNNSSKFMMDCWRAVISVERIYISGIVTWRNSLVLRKTNSQTSKIYFLARSPDNIWHFLTLQSKLSNMQHQGRKRDIGIPSVI